MNIDLLDVAVPLLVMPLIGVIWSKVGLPFDRPTINEVIFKVAAPCLVFHSVVEGTIELTVFLDVFLYGTAILVLCALAGAAMLFVLKMDVRRYLPSIMFPNTGSIGLPVVFTMFGSEGLALGVAFSTLVKIGHCTAGAYLASNRYTLRSLLAMPLLYACLLAFAVKGLDFSLPPTASGVIESIGDITIPMMLLALGVSISDIKLKLYNLSIALALLRVSVGVTMATLFCYAAGVEGIVKGVLIVQSAMPVATFNYLFASKFNGPHEAVSGAIIVSLCFLPVVIPAVAYLVELL